MNFSSKDFYDIARKKLLDFSHIFSTRVFEVPFYFFRENLWGVFHAKYVSSTFLDFEQKKCSCLLEVFWSMSKKLSFTCRKEEFDQLLWKKKRTFLNRPRKLSKHFLRRRPIFSAGMWNLLFTSPVVQFGEEIMFFEVLFFQNI